MIRGIGVDSIEIKRFVAWHSFSPTQLRKIFSDDEIAFCLSLPALSAERFAVRFAVREAFFKALSQLELPKYIPFLTLCKLINVYRYDDGRCVLRVQWNKITKNNMPVLRVHLSMSHDSERAVAFVIIEEE